MILMLKGNISNVIFPLRIKAIDGFIWSDVFPVRPLLVIVGFWIKVIDRSGVIIFLMLINVITRVFFSKAFSISERLIVFADDPCPIFQFINHPHPVLEQVAPEPAKCRYFAQATRLQLTI